jgi:tellurite resistance protein TerC
MWWVGFLALIFVLLSLDLGIFRRNSVEVSFKSALTWTGLWVLFAAGFAAVVGVAFGRDAALLFASGYVVEQALSVDNMFVFGVLFTFFRVPLAYQHRVLFWGILGALVLRGVFIAVGAAVIHLFSWSLYIFGFVLIYTAIKLLFHDDDELDPGEAWMVRTARRMITVTDGFREDAFFVVENGRRIATPLLIVLIAVEGSDVLFAVDSVPAVFGVTSDPFIVYTSNIFAILGLRSLYFLVAGLMGAFHYLKIGLSVILSFIGLKMLVHGWWDVPTLVSLGVIFGTLAIAIAASVIRSWRLGEK